MGRAAIKPVGSRAAATLSEYLADCRQLVLDQLGRIVPRDGAYGPILYDLMLEYPLREAKALRPALSIATCRALGGTLEGVLNSAAVLELYHNAFLIHDDVEDGSEKRRDGPTLHRAHGIPIAINVGDAMLALALEPLFDNMRVLGMGKALRIMRIVARMARESAEGQALELHWERRSIWNLSDRDYLRMVHKKTGWYTFLTPMLVGAVVAGAEESILAPLGRFATALASAFQIQDDLLNLSASEKRYGKEILGDLWEGKRTIMLLHALRNANRTDRNRSLRILRRPRPSDSSAASSSTKSESDVRFLLGLIRRSGSIAYAREIAFRRARRAEQILARVARDLRPSAHLDFLEALASFVVDRDR